MNKKYLFQDVNNVSLADNLLHVFHVMLNSALQRDAFDLFRGDSKN